MDTVDRERASEIAKQWAAAFNDHRADRVVEHFAEDVSATSPVIAQLRPGSGGVLRGKRAVLEFYEEGLRLVPDLHFTVTETLCGIGEVTILYKNQRGTTVAETLSLDSDGMVSSVRVTYGETPAT